MSDYTPNITFATKDALSPGDPLKKIKGSDVDGEFSEIGTASATKYDSADLASQAQAEAGASNTTLLTPLRMQQWSDANGGMAGDIQALADPAADKLLGWDDSASAAIGFGLGTGLAFNLTDVELSFLGLEDLTDPAADRIMFWDDTAGFLTWLTVSTGLTLSGTTLTADFTGTGHDTFSDFVLDEHVLHAGVSVITAAKGLSAVNDDLSSNIGLAIAIAAIDESTTAPAYNDELMFEDAGVLKSVDAAVFLMPLEDTDATATRTLVISDAGIVIRMTSASANVIEIPLDATVAFPINTVIAVEQYGAGVTTIQSTAGATIRSPNAVVAISAQYGRVAIRKIAADEWMLEGRL